MSEHYAQSTYEKLVAAILVMGMAAAGWGPFVFDSLNLPFIERFFLPISLAFALIALGLLYDAAERLLGTGRGLYAAAMFCALPATGMVATDPGMLPDAALMLVCSVGVWMASRARGEERPYFLGFIGVLLIAAGYAFGFRPSALALAFVAWLTARQGGRVRLVAAVLLIAYAVGAAIHELLPPTVPIPKTVAPAEVLTMWGDLLPLSPWALFALPVIWRLATRCKIASAWWSDATAVILLVVAAALLSGAATVKATAALAPVITLLGADMVCEDFRDEIAPLRRRAATLPAALTLLLLVILPVLSASGVKSAPLITAGHAAVAVALATALAWTITQGVPRWSFVLLFASGIFFGRLANQSESLFVQSGAVRAESVSEPLLLVMIGIGIAVWLLAYLLLDHGGKRAASKEYLYGGENFRSFSEPRTGEQKGPVVKVSEKLNDRYSFVIFGDLTGAESPFSTRHGGFLAFRALVKRLQDSHPAFAISLGDLASQATRFAYQRVSKLLRQIPVPLTVTPGNHDLFAHREYDSSQFHNLFGADNAAFRIGPVCFVILNNAWGGLDPQQFTWLEQTLARPPATFTLLFCHKPPFDLRPDGRYAMEDRDHAQRLHKMFRAHGVTAVFSGHVHSLLSERRDGVTYVISGGGGSKLTSPQDHYHYLAVDVDPSELIVRAFPLAGRRVGDFSPLLELHFTPRS